MDNDVLALDFSAMHRVFRLARVFLSPELDDAGIFAEGGLRAHRGEGSKWTEKVVKL